MNLNCVICSDLLVSSDDIHVTPCGHMFHFECLCQWLARSKSCPQCRNKCSLKNIHKIYFNIANFDSSNIDIGSIQQQLDNATLEIKERERENKTLNEELQNHKKIEKLSKATITHLETKLSEKTHQIKCLNEHIRILRVDNKQLEQCKEEIKELKQEINLMCTIKSMITASANEVDKILKEDNNSKTLAIMVATLKRELRTCESKKTDIRNILRITQHNLKLEQEGKSLLEEKVSLLESENCRLLDKLKEYENGTIKENLSLSSPEQIAETLPQIKNKWKFGKNKSDSPSLQIKKHIQEIEDSDSPYLNIKSSSVGLTPILNGLKSGKRLNLENMGLCGLKETRSDLSDKFSILKKRRLVMKSTTVNPANIMFNGFGGSEKKSSSATSENDGYVMKTKKTEMNIVKTKPSLGERIKSGQIKKPSNQKLEKKKGSPSIFS